MTKTQDKEYTTDPGFEAKAFYVAFQAGGTVLKCAGGVVNAAHEEFYRNYFGRFGHGMDWPRRDRKDWEKEPVRFRVVVLPEYLGDRISWREGRWQVTEECAKANADLAALRAAYNNGL